MGKWLGRAEAIVGKAKELVPSGIGQAFGDVAEGSGNEGLIGRAVNKVRYAVVGLQNEQHLNATLHKDVQGALKAVTEANPQFEKLIDQAHGYAVFPAVGRAGLVFGGSFGRGQVFEKRKLIGYAGIVQVTLGLQLGGETLTVVVVFADEAGLKRFKRSKSSFAANASAVLIKAGAGATNQYQGDRVFAFSEGGLLVELAIGVQKFVYRPAALTRGESPEPARAQAKSAELSH